LKFRNIIIILVFLLLASFASSYEVASDPITPIEKPLVNIRDIRNQYIKEFPTKFTENIAKVNHTIGELEQYPHAINSTTEGTILFRNKIKYAIYDICMEFPVHNSLIEIEYIKKENGLLDEDLKTEQREDNKICFKKFNTEENEVSELKYKAKYNGVGTIEYDIIVIPDVYNKNYTLAPACEITLNKGQLEVRVNGVLRTVATGCTETPGSIGFETSRGRAEYRNIVLIPILSDATKPAKSKTTCRLAPPTEH